MIFKLTMMTPLPVCFKTGELDIAESFPARKPTPCRQLVNTLLYRLSFPILQRCSQRAKAIRRSPGSENQKALALTIDRDYVIEVAQNNALPAYAFVPNGMADADGGDFRENGLATTSAVRLCADVEMPKLS
jgi:hypothetical protein